MSFARDRDEAPDGPHRRATPVAETEQGRTGEQVNPDTGLPTPASRARHDLSELQASYGNRYVQRLLTLERQATGPTASAALDTEGGARPGGRLLIQRREAARGEPSPKEGRRRTGETPFIQRTGAVRGAMPAEEAAEDLEDLDKQANAFVREAQSADARADWSVGVRAFRRREWLRAGAAFERSAAASGSPEAMHNAAAAYRRALEERQAGQARRRTSLPPEEAAQQALAAYMAGDYRSAIEAWRPLASGWPYNYWNIGQAYLRMDQPADALEAFAAYQQATGHRDAAPLIARCRRRISATGRPLTEEDVGTLTDVDRVVADARAADLASNLRVGEYLAGRGDNAGAAAAFQRAEADLPEMMGFNAGVSLMRAGRYAEAVREFRRALGLGETSQEGRAQ